VGVAQVRSLDGELGRARSGVEQIGRDAPLLAQWLAGILDDVAAEALSGAPQEPVLSHGDFTPSQLLFSGRRVALLDFDGLCAAEPAFDLGRFLAYLRVALLKSGHPARDGLAAGFLGRYHRAGGPCAPERRVELYGLVSLVLMAVHSCQRLKPARVRLVCDVIGQCRRSMGQPDAEASERRRASGLTATGEPQARSRGASEAASA
jgi:aminoglycoside phosphotransferase (APT) family kinase protein